MTVFFIFPHPDDETIFAGGTILRHVANGDEVVWLCASLGERGGATERRSPEMFYRAFELAGKYSFLLFLQSAAIHWMGIFRNRDSELAKTRKVEAEKVAEIYGIKKVIFLEISDMNFRRDKKEIIEKIHLNMHEMLPDIIYTLHPNGITGHPDHMVLSDCVTESVQDFEGKKPRLFFATFPKYITEQYSLPLLGISEKMISAKTVLSPEELETKRKAIAAYASQLYLWKIFIEKYPELLEIEYFVEII
jgi:N-acetylglucosamine malate deacetylase 2